MQPPLTGFEPVIFYLYFGHRGKQCKLSKIIVLQYVFNCIKTIPCTICVQCQRGLNAGLCHPFIFTSKPHFAITKTVTPKKSLHSKFQGVKITPKIEGKQFSTECPDFEGQNSDPIKMVVKITPIVWGKISPKSFLSFGGKDLPAF